MPDSTVSSCVLNILGSFSSSLGLCKRLKEQRRRLRRSNKKGNNKIDCSSSEEEQRLTRSLRQGPEHISHEYHKNLCAVGDGFAVGDAIAQTSLAETLLRLNVGLVGIITSFLAPINSQKDIELDYKSLADLSERSRIDTCRALRSLLRRLTHFNNSPLRAITERGEPTNAKAAITSNLSSNHKRDDEKSRQRTKIRGSTLAQVVIQNSEKPPQIAMVRPGERRKRVKPKLSPTEPTETRRMQHSSTPPRYTTPPQEARSVAERKKTSYDLQKAKRKQSTPGSSRNPYPRNEDGKPLRAFKSTPRLHPTTTSSPLRLDSLPPIPTLPNAIPDPFPPLAGPTAAASSTPTLLPHLPPHRRRNPTPSSYYSTATASTKLGEIPLHKWNEPYDFDRMELLNREAYQRGWPNDGDVLRDGRNVKRGFWGMFRRRSG